MKGLFTVPRLAGAVFGEDGALPHSWSPMAEISISSLQFEHVIVGRKLAGRMPLAARVAASDIMDLVKIFQDYSRPYERRKTCRRLR